MPYTQDNRYIAIETPLGKDVLLLAGFSGTEGLSVPFSFELEMLSEKHDIAFKDIVGKNVTVSITLADGEKRFFNGVVSRFSQGRGGGAGGGDPLFSYYTATMVPWIWLLKRTANSRIFQTKSVPDIMEKIFSDRGFLDYELHLNGSYDARDYCVQYRETDFNFVSRLLEEEGIFYFFKHEKKKHILVLADNSAEHKPCPKQKTARYQISAGGILKEDTITSLEMTQEIRPGKYTMCDYNFEAPGSDLKIEVSSKQTLGPGEREIYDYPGLYVERAIGDKFANIRMQEEEAQVTTIIGTSECRAFVSGFRFNLTDYFRDDMNDKSYVLTSVDHEATQAFTAGESESEFSYVNNFICIPMEVSYRPPRDTPKPVVYGSQTAIVTGPSGETIYPDKYGRVKVQFHWDREGKKDENSSCWIRVSQLWAGAGWGAMQIPHIGHEVIVSFVEGDPDRPIITGRVYHGQNKPARPLPDEKTKSVIRDNFGNEICFDATKGDEHIHLYSPHHKSKFTLGRSAKTFTMSDKSDLIVGNAVKRVIGDSDNTTVGNQISVTSGNSAAFRVGTSASLSIAADIAAFIGAKCDIMVGPQLSLNASHKSTIGITKEYNRNFAKYCRVSNDDIKMDSQKQVWIVGGDNDASIVKCDKDELSIAFGASTRKLPVDSSKGMAAIAAATAAIAIYNTTLNSRASQLLKAKADLARENKLDQVDKEWEGHRAKLQAEDMSLGLAALSALAFIRSLTPVDTDDPVHTTHHSKISLESGQVTIYVDSKKGKSAKTKIVVKKNGDIQIFAKKNIAIESDKKVRLDSKNIALVADEKITLIAPTVKIDADNSVMKGEWKEG